MKTIHYCLRFAAMLILLAALPSARATLNVLRYYRLGEADPGAVAGGTATNSADSVGGSNLTMTGAPAYSLDAATNSTLALTFNGANYGAGPLIDGLTDNFALEVWVKPSTTSGSQYVVYNGNTGHSGWGLFQQGDHYQAFFGGVIGFGQAPVTLNQWTHLALVRNNGFATFYCNGVLVGTTSYAPLSPSGQLAIAANPDNLAIEHFNGLLDEVRVSTFAPGALEPADLLLPIASPNPKVSKPTGTNVLVTWPAIFKGFGLQYTDGLFPPDWHLAKPDSTNGLCFFQDSPTNESRYYRTFLCGYDGPPGYLPGTGIMVDGVTTINVYAQPPDYDWYFDTRVALDRGDVQADGTIGLPSTMFNVSTFIDPWTCNNGSLSFHWTVYAADYVGEEVHRRGIHGLDTPVLRIARNTMPLGNYLMTLVVTRNADHAETRFFFNLYVSVSSLSQSQWDFCATQTNTCCGCPIENALPLLP